VREREEREEREERAGLAALMTFWATSFERCSQRLEESEFFAAAEQAGLMELAIYDPVAHGTMLGDPELGDVVYVLTGLGKAMLGGVKA
jgi:hypothetical protein